LKIKNQEDFWAGVMFAGFGLLAIVLSLDYPMGTASRMGPGYFPTWLGAMMLIMGVIVALVGLKIEGGEKISPFAWKPMIMLSIGFCLFGWGVDHIGFIPSLLGLSVITSAAGQRFKIVEVLILAVALTAIMVGVFIYGIDLPFPLFWWR
jgi:hypothetical protein